MSGNDFICCFGEHQVADLTSSIDVVDLLQGMSVPETDALVCSATACCKNASLVGVPSNSLDCSCVFAELGNWVAALQVPNHEFVVVSSACKLVSVKRPLESANLLFVAKVAMHNRIADSEVSADHHSVAGSCTYDLVVPGDCTHSAQMAFHCSHLLALHCIPDLSVS